MSPACPGASVPRASSPSTAAQAQNALRQGRAAGLKAAQTLLDSYAALASGVLIGMAQGMQGAAHGDVDEDAPAKPKARRLR
jgi:hypothetical protein